MSSVVEQVPEFLFRGNRDYLHSSTIFDYLQADDPKPASIDFAMHKMTDRQCALSAEAPPERSDTLVATYRSAGLTCYLYETDRPIQGTYPCNEEEICQHTTFKDSTASFDVPPIERATFIESVVGGYKKLLQTLYTDMTRKLVFARMTLERVPGNGRCRVQHRRKIGDEYFQAQLFHDDTPLGKLIFGLQ